VWLIDCPKLDEFTPAQPGLLEVHHGKFRHGQMANGNELNKTTIRLDRSHCYLEGDEARKLFIGSDLYPGVECL
jgi:hypothetical protein